MNKFITSAHLSLIFAILWEWFLFTKFSNEENETKSLLKKDNKAYAAWFAMTLFALPIAFANSSLRKIESANFS